VVTVRRAELYVCNPCTGGTVVFRYAKFGHLIASNGSQQRKSLHSHWGDDGMQGKTYPVRMAPAKQINIRFTEAQLRKIHKLAENMGLDRSAVVRLAVNRLDQEEEARTLAIRNAYRQIQPPKKE
jgi:hypothetical protein